VPVRQDQYRSYKAFSIARFIEDKSEFYDVSGWTQPLAWDIDYAAVRGRGISNNAIGAPVSEFDRSAPILTGRPMSTSWSGTAIMRRARFTACSTPACAPGSSRTKPPS
jgi:hypothetical protein